MRKTEKFKSFFRKQFFYGDPFPVGQRLVTATAYTNSGCSGPVAATLLQSFTVTPCVDVNYAVWDAGRDKYVTSLNNATTITSPPCQVSLGVEFLCGFTPDSVRLELRNAANNALVKSNVEYNAPYFLFKDNGQGNINSGTIAAGEYKLTAIIDGLPHPSVRFTFGVCNPNPPAVDTTFDIDFRLGYSSLSTYNYAQIFPPVVNKVKSLVIGDRPDDLVSFWM